MKPIFFIITLIFVVLFGSMVFAQSKKEQELELPNTNQLNNQYRIIRVIDGDTLKIYAPFLPDPLPKILGLRIHHIDTPEKGSRAKCSQENILSAKATRFVKILLSNAKDVQVELHKWGKYGGRVIGDVKVDGVYLSNILVDNGYAVWYDGGTKTKDWCK